LIKKVENASKLEAFSIEINLARGKHGKGGNILSIFTRALPISVKQSLVGSVFVTEKKLTD